MSIIWRRLRYMLCPQADMYSHLAHHVYDKGVLEVGFGTGFGVLQYAQMADFVDAIDADQDAVNWALENVPLHNVRWLHRDIQYAPPDRKYDVVIAFEVLEHVRLWDAALNNIGRALKDGGVAWLSWPNADADLRKNDNHVEEWTATRFAYELAKFFNDVDLFDYTLANRLPFSTHMSPIVACCGKFKARRYAMPNLTAISYASVDDAAQSLHRDAAWGVRFDDIKFPGFYGPAE